MAAIIILQNRSNKPQVKFGDAQTVSVVRTVSKVQTPTPPSTPDTPKFPPKPEPDPILIQPGTTVYAVWSEDDGLVYKVCKNKNFLEILRYNSFRNRNIN